MVNKSIFSVCIATILTCVSPAINVNAGRNGGALNQVEYKKFAGTQHSAVVDPLPSINSAVYGGGPFYTGGTAVMNDLRASGFTTVMLWCIHVNTDGSMSYNDTRIITNGKYVGRPGWKDELATLKKKPTSVNRIEISVGSGGVADFAHIKTLVDSNGTGKISLLYKGFKSLKKITGADCVNLDVEDTYDIASTVAFATMCVKLGMRVSLCPYRNINYWNAVLTQTNHFSANAIDAVYLQCYSGGRFNVPSKWRAALGGFKNIYPGLWSANGDNCARGDVPAVIKTKMTNWHATDSITGGFMWLYDDIQKCASKGTTADYANAINSAVSGE